MVKKQSICALLYVLPAGLLLGQTIINGGRAVQGSWDASGAAATQPAKKGTIVPATCTVGEQFFKTDAAAGQNLYFCTAANTWTQMKTGSSWDPLDRTSWWAVDDFNGGATGTIGSLGWQSGTEGQGSGSVNGSGSIDGQDAEHPSIVRLNTGSAVAGRAWISLPGSYGAARNLVGLAAKDWEMQWIFKPTGTLTGTSVLAGLTGDPAGPMATWMSSVWVRYAQGTDTNVVVIRNQDGTASTACTGTAAPAIDTWYRLRISQTSGTASVHLYNPSGADLFNNCTFSMVNASEGLGPFILIAGADTTNRSLVVDWFGMVIKGLTR